MCENFLRAFFGLYLVTRQIGVSVTKKSTKKKQTTKGIRQYIQRMGAQCLEKQAQATLRRPPIPSRIWIIIENFYLQPYFTFQDAKKKGIVKAFCAPHIDTKRPAPAIGRLMLKRTRASPTAQSTKLPSISRFLPIKSPSIVGIIGPTAFPKSISDTQNWMTSLSLSHLKSPNSEASEKIVASSGMQLRRSSGWRVQTNLWHQSVDRLGQEQGSWQKRKGEMKKKPPPTQPHRHIITISMIWQFPQDPALSSREKNTLSSSFSCSSLSFSRIYCYDIIDMIISVFMGLLSSGGI